MSDQQPASSTSDGAAPADRPHMVVQLVSQPRYLAPTRKLVTSFARQFGFDDRAAGQIALAVDEALCNIVRHGYGRRTDGLIWVRLWPISEAGHTPAGIRMVIEDEAEQVDPDSIAPRPLEEIRPGGLGVHIIREVMDEVRYEKREQRGMRLTLVRRLPEAGGRDDADIGAGDCRRGSSGSEKANG